MVQFTGKSSLMKWNEDRVICITDLQLDVIAISTTCSLHIFDQEGKHTQHAFSRAIQSIEWIDNSIILVKTEDQQFFTVKDNIQSFCPDLTYNNQHPVNTIIVKLDARSVGLLCVYGDACVLYRVDASLNPSSLWQYSINDPKSVHFSSFYPL